MLRFKRYTRKSEKTIYFIIKSKLSAINYGTLVIFFLIFMIFFTLIFSCLMYKTAKAFFTRSRWLKTILRPSASKATKGLIGEEEFNQLLKQNSWLKTILCPLPCITREKVTEEAEFNEQILVNAKLERELRSELELERKITQSPSLNSMFINSIKEAIEGLEPFIEDDQIGMTISDFRVKVDKRYAKVLKKRTTEKLFFLNSTLVIDNFAFNYFSRFCKNEEFLSESVKRFKAGLSSQMIGRKGLLFLVVPLREIFLIEKGKDMILLKVIAKIEVNKEIHEEEWYERMERKGKRMIVQEESFCGFEPIPLLAINNNSLVDEETEINRVCQFTPDPLYEATWIEDIFTLRKTRIECLHLLLEQNDFEFWQQRALNLTQALVDKIRQEEEHAALVKRLGGEPVKQEVLDKIFELEGYHSEMTEVRVRIRDMRHLTRKRMLKERDEAERYDQGVIIKLKDGIATVKGLKRAKSGEILYIFNQFDDSNQGQEKAFIKGLVLNLNLNDMDIIVLGNDNLLKEGNLVFRSFNLFEVSTTLKMFGEVVDALGRSKKTGLSFGSNVERMGLVEKKAAGIIDRVPVNIPLRTGLKSVDSLVPIGRGQRELIIGDRQTGKTAVCIDTILNHAKINNEIKAFVSDKKASLNDLRNIVWFIYAAVAQKQSSVSEISKRLEKNKAGWYTAIVSSTAADPAPLQFLVPYTACTLGEYIRDFVGGHCTVVYDDLSKHAVAYRQMSLLLRRPPGREAFPGDVFYIHSRLLERAGALRDMAYVKVIKFTRTPFFILTGKRMNFWSLPVVYPRGTLTALPVIETQAGDVSAYIPTNVISITDGQIFLETELFYKGIRPAINVGLSVSRVGSAAQPFIMKKVSGSLKMELAQFREVESFAKLSSNLDSHTQRILTRGENLIEILKQNLNKPLSTMKQVLSIFLGLGFNTGWLSDIVANTRIKLGSYISLTRLTMSWFELFRMSSTQFTTKDINLFLSSFLKFYEAIGLSTVLELPANEELNGLVLKKYSNYILDDLVIMFLVERSEFKKREFAPRHYLNKLKLKFLPKTYRTTDLKAGKMNTPKLKLTKLNFATDYKQNAAEAKGATNLRNRNGMNLFFQLPLSVNYFKDTASLKDILFKKVWAKPFLAEYFNDKFIKYNNVVKCFLFITMNLIWSKLKIQPKKESTSVLDSGFVNLINIISELLNPFCRANTGKQQEEFNKALQYRLNNFKRFVSEKKEALSYLNKYKYSRRLNFKNLLLFLRLKDFTGERGLFNIIKQTAKNSPRNDLFKFKMKVALEVSEVVASNVRQIKESPLQLNFNYLGTRRNELMQYVSLNLVSNKLLRIKKTLTERLNFDKVNEENILAFDGLRMVVRRSFIYLLPRWRKLNFKNLQFKKIIKRLRETDLKLFTIFYQKMDDSSIKILDKYGIWFIYIYNFAIQQRSKWLVTNFKQVIEKLFVVSSDVVDFKLFASRIINNYGKEVVYQNQ